MFTDLIYRSNLGAFATDCIINVGGEIEYAARTLYNLAHSHILRNQNLFATKSAISVVVSQHVNESLSIKSNQKYINKAQNLLSLTHNDIYIFRKVNGFKDI